MISSKFDIDKKKMSFRCKNGSKWWGPGGNRTQEPQNNYGYPLEQMDYLKILSYYNNRIEKSGSSAKMGKRKWPGRDSNPGLSDHS